MFEVSRSLVIIAAFTIIVWFCLSVFYFLLSRVLGTDKARLARQVFVFVAVLTMAYLLRRTFVPMLNHSEARFVAAAFVVAMFAALYVQRIISRVNIVLGIMCVLHVGMGTIAIIDSNPNPMTLFDQSVSREAIYDEMRFQKKLNVYYIVPDGHPSADALHEVFSADPVLEQDLKELEFKVYPSTFSNYMGTLSSISSVLGMDHHSYRNDIGNFEQIGARQYIVSRHSPVVRIFQNNGYEVHYVHEDGFLFLNGCLIDSCSPMGLWAEIIEIFIPHGLMPRVGEVAKMINGRTIGAEQTDSEFMQRVRGHVDRMAHERKRHFTYIHTIAPGHSFPGDQTSEELARFRKDYLGLLRASHNQVLEIVRHILNRDSDALIIVNGDHGAWGHGSFMHTKMSLLNSLSARIITLDQVGVLLAIRWPDGLARSDENLRTNVNLFRYIFAYLSENTEILTTKVPDDSFLVRWDPKRWDPKPIVQKVVNNGEVLERMGEVN